MKSFVLFIFFSCMGQETTMLFDFKTAKNTAQWSVVNDGVMGGLSKGEIISNDAGNGIFKGYITTENNGGFSSVRYEFSKKDVSKFNKIVLRIKGDGKLYQFRIKENTDQRYSYIASFETTGAWQTIKIPFSTCYPGYRGTILNKPNYAGETMEEIAFLIGNNKKESFALEIETITLE